MVKRAITIAAIYLLLGVLWIYFSDHLLYYLYQDQPDRLTAYHTYCHVMHQMSDIGA